MPSILITGGTGYIGSHTAIEIIQQGRFDVVSVDNYQNSSPAALDRIEAITGVRMKNYDIDACDLTALEGVFAAHPDIEGVIHFAALKAVGESVEKPLLYYQNNLNSLANILLCCEKFDVPHMIFSSSCTVYGEIDELPVTEATPTTQAESPYGNTKLIGERMIQDFVKVTPGLQAVALRYFNPVGAHESGLNGEDPLNKPNNLLPIITRVASGLIPQLTVYGGDYPTRDGTCIRDYIHVTDLALAHIKALDYLREGRNEAAYEQFNLGAGEGVSVLEAIRAFEEYTGQKLNYVIGDRRPGDVTAIYSDSSLAAERLGWVAERGIEEMMRSSWKWQETLNQAREAT
ncbi:MAG: UDP-glucose 4-epimerase GalE, partial [Bacteroidetes bacterium]